MPNSLVLRSNIVRATPHGRNYRGRQPAITIIPSTLRAETTTRIANYFGRNDPQTANDNADGGGRFSKIVLLK